MVQEERVSPVEKMIGVEQWRLHYEYDPLTGLKVRGRNNNVVCSHFKNMLMTRRLPGMDKQHKCEKIKVATEEVNHSSIKMVWALDREEPIIVPML